jgi:HD-like signal output (HDOD) protein
MYGLSECPAVFLQCDHGQYHVPAFAWAQAIDPETESETQAKVFLLENANKLKRLLLSQEAAQINRETYRAQGDWDAERELFGATHAEVGAWLLGIWGLPVPIVEAMAALVLCDHALRQRAIDGRPK